MKKYLLLLASAALLLVGCAKEKFAEPGDGGLTKATFSVSVDGGVATRALADNDGKGANVNRCIMEIYFQNQLYKRMEEPAAAGVATFANVPVVAGKEYQILFWADHVDVVNTEVGLATDKYYTTKTTTGNKGLKAVTVNGTAFKGALETGKNDELDAFYAAQNYTVSQTGDNAFTINLHRPFAQLNVITTDVAAGKTVISADLLPEKVSVSYTAATTFNVADSTVTGSATYEYEAPVYGGKTDWGTVKARGEYTLSMDYILAAKDQRLVNVTFKTLNGTTEVMTHNLTNLPYQRNYRTNVKGDLLTVGGSWKAEITPAWTGETTHPVVIATTLAEAQAAFGPVSGGEAASTVIVKPEAVTNRDQSKDKTSEQVIATTPGIALPEGAKAIEFVLTPQSQKDVTFELPALPSGNFYWYIRHEEGYPTENLNIKVDSNDATRVIVDAPDDTHVVLNDVVYAHVVAITGENTLVVPQGITVQKLSVKKGGVEIHGIVNELEIIPDQGQNVYFRACEGLSATVFEKIYKQGVCNYIDPMYAYKLDGEKYNIYKLPVVAMIGEKEYPSIAAAVAAVPANNTEPVTINLMSDVVLKKADALTVNKNNVVLDGQDHTIALDENDEALAGYVDSKYGQFHMIKVSGKNVTLKNMTLDGNKYRGASLATSVGGEDVVYENIVYNGKGSAHYYSTNGNGLITFKNCKINTCGYAIHSDTAADGIAIDGCEIHGWNAFGAAVTSVSIKNSKFFSAEDSKNGTLAAFSIYCPTTFTNCTFSMEFVQAGTYEGIFFGKNSPALVSLDECSVEEEVELYKMVRTDDKDWPAGAVVAIDATGNATDGFTAGTFVAKQASDIKVAGLNEAVPVEGKENVYTIVPKQLDETTVAVLGATEYSTFEAAMQAALDAKGGTVTLVKDVTLAKSWDHGSNIGDNRDKYSFVLNLNGKTIFRGPNNYHISLCDNDWTVIDETGEGTINKASDGTSNLTLWCANGHDPFFSKMAKFETCPVFILNGGTYIGGTFGVDFQAGGSGDGHMAICKFLLNKATVKNMRILNGQGEIKDGTFSGKITLSVDDTKYTQFGITLDQFTTTISGGNFTLDQSEPFVFQSFFPQTNLRIIGGTFNFDPSVNYSDCIPEGYTSQDNGDGTWTVVAAE